MLFFKPKHKYDEILPPPPPFPTLEFEEQKEKPKFFDEIIEPEAAETFLEEKEFGSLITEIDKRIEPKKGISKKQKIKKASSKIKQATKQKILKIKLKHPEFQQLRQKLHKLQVKSKGKNVLPKTTKVTKKLEKQFRQEKVKVPDKTNIKKVTKISKPSTERSFDFGPGFELPKEIEYAEEEIKLPETLEEANLDIEKEIKQELKTKPKEILEAEEEIKSAIEKIKEREKPSFFKKFFVKKKIGMEPAKESLLPTIRDLDEVSIIRNKIDDARQALMRFDLETAKKDYIEIIRIYNNIKPEDKAKVYRDINELYSERKSAEELKV